MTRDEDREDAERWRALKALANGARVTIETLDDKHATVEIRAVHNRVECSPLFDRDLDTIADRLRERLTHGC